MNIQQLVYNTAFTCLLVTTALALAPTVMPAAHAQTLDVAYGTNAAQRLDIYAPAGATNAPVMIYVHGGGWRRGDKGAVHLKAGHFTGSGWVFMSVNYRLPPDGRYPDNVKDVARAVAWVREHGAQYGGNPDAIFLMGHSAGCHLVSLVATDDRYLKQVGVPLTILKGVLALDTQAYNIAQLMKERSPELYENAFGNDPATHKEASPVSHVAEGRGIPPFLICYSRGVGTRTNPTRGQHARGFAEKLRAAGVQAEVVDASDRSHEEINRRFGGPQDDNVTGRAMAFLNSLLPADVRSPIQWTPSLVFTNSGPLPVNAMNLTAHKGMLFCGLATSFESNRYSRAGSYVYVKRAADKSWELDADFGPGTSRVGAMCSARFRRDNADVLVAFTLQSSQAGEAVLQARIRDDASGTWGTFDLPVTPAGKPNVRVLHMHRDSVTGEDRLFVAASPSPLGILSGGYDASVPGRIRWSARVETTATSRRGECKWFGIATANGALFASDAHKIYRRADGPSPTWRVVSEFPVVRDEDGASVRGLTAVPNPAAVTGWSEPEMLVFGTRCAMWRMRAPADPAAEHARVQEIELIPWLSERLKDQVVFVEPAFNELRRFRGGWPVGFQVAFGVEGRKVSWDDAASYRTKPNAWWLRRDDRGRYELGEIAPRVPAEQPLFLARDFLPSPFPGEANVLYACGFNGSYFKNSLGTAWVYKGETKP